MNPSAHISLRGVRQNNLKNIDIDIPLQSLTVICGPSGSGKSSLAFETLYSESQRRYIESLSSYARQFLNKAPQPDLDSVENIPPAIAIEQKNYVKTSRSTVGTTTEIIGYLRLLFAKLGRPYCPEHNVEIKSESVTTGVEHVIEKLNGKRGYVLSLITKKYRIAKGKKLLELLLKDGYIRIAEKNKIIDLTTKSSLPSGDFYVVVDRLVFCEDDRGRLADSIAQAYMVSQKYNSNYSGGRAEFLTIENEHLKISEDPSCSICEFSFPPISAKLFNFNSPLGACSRCNGFGNLLLLDEKKIVSNPNLSLSEGAVVPFAMPSARSDRRQLLRGAEKAGIDIDAPWSNLTQKQKNLIWKGNKNFYGIEGLFDYLEGKKYKMHVRVFLSRFKSAFPCEECEGTRLRKDIKHILINKKNIMGLSKEPISNLNTFFKSIKLSRMEEDVSSEVLAQIRSRLQFLVDVGVGYLTLDRETRTLSGGEYQRINLANQLGMSLSQTLYVLDEPTVGLHPKDNDKLINILKQLKDLGNTLAIVEHDKSVIKNSEHVIELGPGSGHMGGEVVFSGNREDFYKQKESKTVLYLKLDEKWTPARTPRPIDVKTYKYKIGLKGCSGHNLKNVNVEFPLNCLIVVTGVSGSGKSTLISQTLYPALEESIGGQHKFSQPFKSLVGESFIKKVIFIDQKPIGKSSRSNPVTYTKVFDEIRNIMASTEEAKEKGYTSRYFSLNVDAGRCPTCRGEGNETIDMAFMDDVTLICDTCDGKRFQKNILDIKFRGKNIDDVLNMTVAQAMDFFVSFPKIRRPLAFLKEVGLDYLTLGQSAKSLSGGESQRLKVAKELSSSQQKSTLYILDEPTTGLHPHEVQLLLQILNKLIDAGGSVIVIEHNLDVIKSADYIVELGPGGGSEGGKVLFSGLPEDLVRCKRCPTAPYLRSFFQLPVRGKIKKKVAARK